MNISELSIRRPVLATVLTIIILLFGLIGYNTLGVREYPSVDNPIISVTCSYSGANADVIENQITEPLEQNINGIPGIRSLSSVSQQGQCRITVEFELSVDLETAANDVRDKVSRAQRYLPRDCDPPTGFLVIFKVDFRTQFEMEADLERFENLNSIGFFINFRAGDAFKGFGNRAANGAVDVFDAVLLFCNVEIYVKVGTKRREAVILPVRFDKFGHGIFDFVCEVRRFGKPAYAKFHRLVDAAFRADDVQCKFLETVVADIRDKRRVKRLFARQNIADKEVDDAFDNVGLSAQQAVDDVADLFKQGLIRENRVEFRGHHEIDRTVGIRYRVTAAFGNKGKQDIEQREFIVAVRSQNGGNKVFNACVVNKAAKVVIRQHFFDFQLVENILEKPHYVCDIRIGHVVTMHRLARFIVVEVDIHIAALCVNAKDNRRKVGAFFQHFKGHYAFVDGILFVIASAESVDGTFDFDGVFIRLAFLFDVNVRCERERYVP